MYKIDADWVYVKSLMANIKWDTGGQVPLNYLNPLEILDYLLKPESQQIRLYIAITNFKFETKGDLDFQKGQLLK